MKKTKLLAILLAVLMVLSLVLTGCKKKKGQTEVPAETPAEETGESVNNAGSEEPDDAAEEAEGADSFDADDLASLLEDADLSAILEDEEVASLIDDASAFYARMQEETEGMTKDEAVDYYLREALATLKEEVPEVRQEQIQSVMDELYDSGLLTEEALYDAENWLFTFIYESGIQGGIAVKETSPVMNGPRTNTRPAPSLRSAHTDAPLQTVVLNAFEDVPYRTDFYNSLYSEWTDLGVGITLDSEVTVADLANLDTYDVIVFSMHGGTYMEQPILAINEVPTAETDQLYYQYLANERSVSKVMYIDGSSAYWIMPSFFYNVYGDSGLDGKVIFSEACAFYGCECYCTDADVSLASSFANASAEVVIGYFNSVEANYSREVMKSTLEYMFEGDTAYDALSMAIGVHGETDEWEDPTQDKFYAYPIFMGEASTVIVAAEEEVPEAPVEEEYDWYDDGPGLGDWFGDDDYDFGIPEIPELSDDELDDMIGWGDMPADPNADWYDFDFASDRIYTSLMDQLIGVYAEARRDGTYYLPYYNDTGYTFTVDIDLDYWYLGNCVFEDTGYSYTLEPGDYIEIPVYFPEFCDAWNLWFVYSNMYYEGTYIG